MLEIALTDELEVAYRCLVQARPSAGVPSEHQGGRPRQTMPSDVRIDRNRVGVVTTRQE